MDSREPRDGAAQILAAVLTLESLATLGMALWLFWVTATVLPARDPGHIPMWRAVAGGFLAYCALCWASVATHPRVPILRWVLLLASLAAVALGVFGIVTMLRQGGHFEGYILLMGLVLAGHGTTGIAYTLIAGRPSGSNTGPGSPGADLASAAR